MKRLQVFISGFGLDLSRNAGVWPQAIEVDGKTYDLIPGPAGAQYVLSKPHLTRDGQGRIIAAEARTMREAQHLAKAILASGALAEVAIRTSEGVPFHEMQSEVALSCDGDMLRLAAKIAAGLLVYAGFGKFINDSDIPKYLHGGRPSPASFAYCNVDAIRALRNQIERSRK